jgi:hypothetical protein
VRALHERRRLHRVKPRRIEVERDREARRRPPSPGRCRPAQYLKRSFK